MSLALINTALASRSAKTATAQEVVIAEANDTAAALATAHDDQAEHDDLLANGPEVTVDLTQTPPVVVEYTAVEPGSFLATPVRVAV